MLPDFSHTLAAPHAPTLASYARWLAPRWLTSQNRPQNARLIAAFNGVPKFLPSLTLALVTRERIEALADLAPAIFLEYPPTAAASTDREICEAGAGRCLLHVSHHPGLPLLRWKRGMQVLVLCLCPLESSCHHVAASCQRLPKSSRLSVALALTNWNLDWQLLSGCLLERAVASSACVCSWGILME